MAAGHTSLYDILRARGAIGPNDVEIRVAVERAERLSDLMVAVTRFIDKGVRAVANYIRNERVRSELAAMTERELADIGLSRSDLYRRDLSSLRREDRARGTGSTVVANQNGAKRDAA